MGAFPRHWALWGVIGLIGILLFNLFSAQEPRPGEIAFSDFLNKVDAGEVRGVTIRGESITASLKDGSIRRVYGIVDAGLVKTLREHGVEIWVKPPESGPWYTAVLQWIPMFVFIGVWIYFMRRMPAEWWKKK